jgi:uncharacterized protein involved in exopolysaccharide biosynthesis
MQEKQLAQGTVMPSVQAQKAEQQDEITIDLVELFYRLLAGWKLILCLALCFAIAAAVYTLYFVTPMYRATAVIFVVSPDSIINLSQLQFASALTNDYIKVFNLWEVHEEVISNLGLNYSYSDMQNTDDYAGFIILCCETYNDPNVKLTLDEQIKFYNILDKAYNSLYDGDDTSDIRIKACKTIEKTITQQSGYNQHLKNR